MNESGDVNTQPEGEDPKDAAALKLASHWEKMIKDAEKVFAPWQDKCDNIAKQYADLERLANTGRSREMQVFWANIEVIKPTIYARPPIPVVTGRFKDRKPLVRKTSEVMERCLMASFDTEVFHDTLIEIRDDLALFGRGAAPWLRYKTEADEAELEGEGGSDAYQEYICYDHLDRKDFLHEPARKWKEVGWVARRSWLTGKQGSSRFKDAWVGIDYKKTDNDTDDEYTVESKAEVWEIWDKTLGVVVWLHPGKVQVLEMDRPHLNLEGFFPCSKPAYSTCQPNTLIPVPDFMFYKDQVEEINDLTGRISALTESLRLKGFYAAGEQDVADAIETAMRDLSDNALLVPVPSTAALGPGGVKDAIIWLPVQDIVQVITALVQERRNLIDDVYQITGISDIMRGDTQASETATAQNIKAQYGSVRIKGRQGEMVRIADHSMRLSAEIMAENFKPETLLSMSQVDDIPTAQDVQQQAQQALKQASQQIQSQLAQQAQQPPQQGQPAPDPQQLKAKADEMLGQARQQAEQTIQNTVTVEAMMHMLRDQRVRPFVFQVASDSTIQPDEDREKQRRNEYAGAVGTLLTQAAPLVQTFPKSAPMVGEMLQFVTSAYRAGRQMESSIDEFVDQMTEMAKQPQGPDPEQQRAEMEAKVEAGRIQAEQAATEKQMQFDQKMQDMEFQLKQFEAQAKQQEIMLKAQTDAAKAQAEGFKHELALQMKSIDLRISEVRLQEATKRAKQPKGNGHDRRARN